MCQGIGEKSANGCQAVPIATQSFRASADLRLSTASRSHSGVRAGSRNATANELISAWLSRIPGTGRRAGPQRDGGAHASAASPRVSRIYFRADAGFANPEVYEFLEAERIKYAIRLPANRVLQERIGHLLTRPVGRPSNEVRRSYANFTYQAGSWAKPRRVIAKVEWHPGELYPRVGFIVTNMSRPAENVVAFYNKRGT
jgi:hypothetical protein